MSDVSSGPGWWLASDGNWYAPELHPEFPLQRSSQTSDAPVPTSGWWLASDGNWYPPELHPGKAPGGVDHPAPTADAAAVLPTSAETQGASFATTANSPRPRFHRGIYRLLVAAVVVVAGVAAALTVTHRTAGFPTGTGSATITWQRVAGSSPAPQPYRGTIAGIPLSGTAVTATAHVSGGTGGGVVLPSTIALARWTGRFDGRSFNLIVSTRVPAGGLSALATPSGFVVTVAGTYGGDPVRGTMRPIGSSSSARFDATIGPDHVTGIITAPTQSGSTGSVKATFTVTG
jgi:hypothetical protein